VFAEHVHDLLRRGLDPNREEVCGAIERCLRDVYPQVRATIRTDVAGFGDRVIYVFRDGTVGTSDGGGRDR
jgi:hypothetical protein